MKRQATDMIDIDESKDVYYIKIDNSRIKAYLIEKRIRFLKSNKLK